MATPSTTSGDLLQASLTGDLPADAQASFSREREAGNDAYRRGDLDLAIEHYTRAEIINPLSPLPPANRSMVHLKRREWQRAREEASVALELQAALPSHLHSDALSVKLHLRRATACSELSLRALAVDDYRTVLRLDPSHTAARTALARLEQQESEGISILPGGRVQRDSTNSAALDVRGTGEKKNKPLVRVIQDVPSNGTADGKGAARSTTLAVSGNASRRNGTVGSAVHDESPLISLSKETRDQLASEAAQSAPRSGSDFEHAWRSLGEDPIMLAQYLVHTVGVTRIPLLTACFTPELLEQFISVLHATMDLPTEQNPGIEPSEIGQMLVAVAKIERFPLMMMFMSEGDREPFNRLIDRLQSSQKVDVLTVQSLRQAYCSS